MKKSSFIALIMGTAAGVLFALGMCMTLLPEWNAFTPGVILGCAGLLLGSITFLIWFRMEGRQPPKVNTRNLLRILFGAAALLVLGCGMCLCLVWQKIIWGVLVGLLGIIMLIALIPMIRGLK